MWLQYWRELYLLIGQQFRSFCYPQSRKINCWLKKFYPFWIWFDQFTTASHASLSFWPSVKFAGKNDLTQHVTHGEAVSGMVIGSIFDTWHYEVLWTYALTTLLWYACDYVPLILYIMLHSTKLPNALHCLLPSKLSRRSQDALKYTPYCTRWHTASLLNYTLPSKISRCSQVPTDYAPKYPPSMLPSTPSSMFSSTLPGMLSRTLPISLDGTLPACLTICSHIRSHDALNHTPEHALKFTPNCTRWHTPSLLDNPLPSKLSKRSQSHSQLHSMTHSQHTWLYPPNSALKTLSITLPSMLSSTTPIALDGTLPACLPVRSQVSSKDTPRITSGYAPKYTSESLASTLSRGNTLPISLDYMLPCMLLYARSTDLLGCRRQALRGMRLVAYVEHSLAGGGLWVACGLGPVAGGTW